MPSYTGHSFTINVMLVGRNDVITSHSYSSREAAEADLRKITDARQGGTEVDLPWLQMPGNQVQAAYVEQHTVSVGFV